MRLRWEGVVHTMMRWTIVILATSFKVPVAKLAHALMPDYLCFSMLCIELRGYIGPS
jgi:hypothetical protein